MIEQKACPNIPIKNKQKSGASSEKESEQEEKKPLEKLLLSRASMSEVLGKLLESLKKEPAPSAHPPVTTNPEETAKLYFQKYSALFAENQQLNNSLIEANQQRLELAEKYNKIKRNILADDAVKRKRRYAKDIERQYFCPIPSCKRGYGSEGSLSHHVRLKHIEFYQSGAFQVFLINYMDSLHAMKVKIEEQESNHVKIEHNPVSVPEVKKQQVERTKRRNHVASNLRSKVKIEEDWKM